MVSGYSFQNFDAKNMVKVVGKNMPISPKQSYEIANFIRGKQIDAIIRLLDNVIVQKIAVPYRRYNRDICHKPGGVGPGRYPKKASEHIILLLKNLRGQAQDKGLDINKVFVIHAAMQRGAKLRHYGRKIGLVRKNTHFELVGREMEKAVKKDKPKSADLGSSASQSEKKTQETKPATHVEPAKTHGDTSRTEFGGAQPKSNFGQGSTSHGVKK